MKPIFSHADLGSDTLLGRCLDGETQNANESLNGVIWKRCPKDVYVGSFTLKVAVASAVISFNDGLSGIKKVISSVGMSEGCFVSKATKKVDQARIALSVRKSGEKAIKQRKKLRAIRKGYQDIDIEQEGDVYESGAF